MGTLLNPYILSAGLLEFFVKSDGSDSDDGLTVGTAWATLEHAQTEVQALLPTQSQNIRVNVLDAILQAAEFALVAADSGTNGFTVTWDGGGSGQTIVGAIDAGTRIGSWSIDDYDLNIWSASYSGPAPRAIWVNGRRSYRVSRGAGLIGGSTLISTGYTAAGDAILTDPNPANIELVYGAWFQQPHNMVDSISGNDILMIDPAHTYITDVPGYGYVSDMPVDVLNCEADFLAAAAAGTAAGTYYYDEVGTTIYYVPRPYIEDMATAEVIAPNGLTTVVSMAAGTENVFVNAMGILYSHWAMPTGFAERAQNFFYDNTSPWVTPTPADDNMPAAIYPPAAVYVAGAVNCGMTNCNILHHSCMGVHLTLETTAFQFIGSLVNDTDGNSMVIGDCIEATAVACSSGLTVTNNVFSNYGRSLYGAAGISIPFVAESDISNNYLFNGTYSGITFYIGGTIDASWTTKCTNNTANQNFLNYLMRQTSDGAAIYVNNFAADLSWDGNFLNYITQHDQTGGFGSEVIGGLYMDNDATFANASNTVMRKITNPYLFNLLPATNNCSVGAGYADNNDIIVTTELPDSYTAITVSATPWTGAGAAIVAAAGVGVSYRPLLKSKLDGVSAGQGSGTGALTVVSLEPDDLADLLIWLKADAIVGLNDGDPVDTWDDSSGNANDATSSGANRPAYETSGINSLPTVRFEPDPTVTGEFFDLPLTESASDYTAFFVVNNLDYDAPFAGDAQYWLSNDPGGGNRLLVASPAPLGGPPPVDIGYNDSAWHYIAAYQFGVQVICVRLEQAVAGEIFRDGVSLGTSTYTQQPLGTVVRLGSDDGTGAASPFRGDISEFFMYTRALSDSEIDQMMAYINNKYNL